MHKFRWLASVVAAVALACGATAAAVPGGTAIAVDHGRPAVVAEVSSAAAGLIDDGRPRPTVPNPVPTPSLAPIVVMSVGDSLTEGTDPATKATPLGSYRPYLTNLLNATGQPHAWVIAAQGGTKCSHWAAVLGSLIDTYHPRLILLNCGTNDEPGIDNTEADYRTMLAAAQSRGVPLVASLIGRPYMGSLVNQGRPWIEAWMDATNDAIRRALAAYPSVPYANMLRVPNNPEWLTDDGIHITARAEAAWAQLFYAAAQLLMGWLTLAQMRIAEMCGLSGHDRDDPWPTGYRVCLT